MAHIILNEEQANVLRGSTEPVELRDEQGTVLEVVKPLWTEAELEEIRQRLKSDEPRYSLDEVMRHLESLES